MTERGKYIYDWPRPMVTVDAAVFSIFKDGPKLLLIQRKYPPFEGQWAIPGGFIEMDEELADAAARELEEETGLTDIKLEQIHTFGGIGRDPRGRQITIVFMGIAKEGQTKITAGDDAEKAQWFDIEKPPDNMAFDHDKVAAFAIKKLKSTA